MTQIIENTPEHVATDHLSQLDPEEIYNISYWGEGYFRVSDSGELRVGIPGETSDIQLGASLHKVLEAAQEADLKPPLLVRITNILGHRATRLCQAFAKAFEKQSLEKNYYTAIYPIKVNQQKRVIQEILSAKEKLPKRLDVGLEAGSKPEFIAALCSLPDTKTPLICNGYKDEEYLRLAIHATQMGYNIFVVIEKLSELETFLSLCSDKSQLPKLGVRVRLHSTGKGNWQNTGGDKGKFGLTAPQLVQAISLLKTHQWLDRLEMLHVHIGSQISDIQDLARCLQEVGRYYIELHKIGAQCGYLDVGGGLGVDYEGTASDNYHSINYNVEEYAQTVVNSIARQCKLAKVPMPHLLTESGRALTAHHAVLLTNIVDTEQHNLVAPQALQQMAQQADEHYVLNSNSAENCSTEDNNDSTTLLHLKSLSHQCQQALRARDAVTAFHQLQDALTRSQQEFQAGTLSLSMKAVAEGYFFDACQHLLPQLNPGKRVHQPIIQELNELLAHRLFLNFSLFQSTPDVWGIGQIFPIMPISGLHSSSYVRARLNDLTCDSDGRFDLYVDSLGLESTLPLPQEHIERCSIVGIFLIGAYQEILGDLHNLFGDTNAVDVTLTGKDQFTLSNLRAGDATHAVLSHVNFTQSYIQEQLESKIMSSQLPQTQRTAILKYFQSTIGSSTYLK